METALLKLDAHFPELTIRVSLDHYGAAVHEAERGAETWRKTVGRPRVARAKMGSSFMSPPPAVWRTGSTGKERIWRCSRSSESISTRMIRSG